MTETVDVLIMINGMVPESYPIDLTEVYQQFYDELINTERGLVAVLDASIHVQWGHELPNISAQRSDEQLTRAQLFTHHRVSFDAVRTDTHPGNIMLPFYAPDSNIPGLRVMLASIRERVIHFGLGNAVYYCSPDGEKNIRKTVYEQILTEINKFEAAKVVRLHIIGHSLGVILSHDFLFGLFAPVNHRPGFIVDRQGSTEAIVLFNKWRARAKENRLHLGTLISTASQLPVFMFRRQRLVNLFFNGMLLDPAHIGIRDQTAVRWLIFYDIDDILGFTSRRLYEPTLAIKEIQVDIADRPDVTHSRYWQNQTVIRETAQLIYNNASA